MATLALGAPTTTACPRPGCCGEAPDCFESLQAAIDGTDDGGLVILGIEDAFNERVLIEDRQLWITGGLLLDPPVPGEPTFTIRGPRSDVVLSVTFELERSPALSVRGGAKAEVRDSSIRSRFSGRQGPDSDLGSIISVREASLVLHNAGLDGGGAELSPQVSVASSDLEVERSRFLNGGSVAIAASQVPGEESMVTIRGGTSNTLFQDFPSAAVFGAGELTMENVVITGVQTDSAFRQPPINWRGNSTGSSFGRAARQERGPCSGAGEAASRCVARRSARPGRT